MYRGGAQAKTARPPPRMRQMRFRGVRFRQPSRQNLLLDVQGTCLRSDGRQQILRSAHIPSKTTAESAKSAAPNPPPNEPDPRTFILSADLTDFADSVTPQNVCEYRWNPRIQITPINAGPCRNLRTLELIRDTSMVVRSDKRHALRTTRSFDTLFLPTRKENTECCLLMCFVAACRH